MTDLQKTIEGKYEILGKMREGGMGAVYKVRHRLLDEVRVVKVVRPHLGASPGLADRFLREARSAIQLRHPNIAQLFDFSVDEEGGAFIVMELIDGATLEDLVKSGGPPPLGLALDIAQQSLRAIGFLHRKGFLHRDITPDNLMLTRDVDGNPLVKLIDLGIAKVLTTGEVGGDLTVAGLFLGKPRYASPEQWSSGADKVDARSDLYSFGTVFYELLTGMPPITGRDPSSLMAGHLFRPPVPFSESDPEGRIPLDLRAIVEKTLAKQPEDRFASAEELARSLAAVQQRFAVAPGDLDRALELASPTAAVPRRQSPGSTQDELDRRFAQVAAPDDRTVQIFETVPLPEPEPTQPPVPPSRTDLPLTPPAARATLVLPKRPPEPREPPRWRRATPWEAMAALALVALVVMGILVWSRRSEEPPPPAPVATAPLAAQPEPVALPVSTRPDDPPPPQASPPQPSVSSSPARVEAPPPARAPAAETAPPAKPSPPAAPPPAVRRRQVVEVPLPLAGEDERERAARGGRAGRDEEPPMKRGDLIFGGPDVQGPRLDSSPKAVYPPALAGTGRRARVVLEVLVDENGAVSEARVLSTWVDDGSAATAFSEAALAAAREARFKPPTRSGIPGRMWGTLSLEFQPNDP